MTNQQDPATPAEDQDGPDQTGGVGEHVPETPDAGDVDHLEGEFGELDKLTEPDRKDSAGTGGEPVDSEPA
jgi:hypothetical protein